MARNACDLKSARVTSPLAENIACNSTSPGPGVIIV